MTRLRSDQLLSNPYALVTKMSVTAPVDATNYYCSLTFTNTTSAGTYGRLYIPASGTIRKIYLQAITDTSAGTAEFYAPNGNFLFAGCSSATAVRFQ